MIPIVVPMMFGEVEMLHLYEDEKSFFFCNPPNSLLVGGWHLKIKFLNNSNLTIIFSNVPYIVIFFIS